MFEENGVCIEVYISQVGCGYSWRCTRVEDDDINKDKKRRMCTMIHCDECRYHEDIPLDEIYDPLTNEEWTIWGMYCNKYDKEYEFDHKVDKCSYYQPYKKNEDQ